MIIATARVLSLLACLALAAPLAVSAQELEKPKGPVVLTVTGAIQKTNRGPFDPDRDGLFNNTNVRFDKAAVFDLAMLERLGVRQLRTDFPQNGPVHTFEGPLLRDVLKAAGAAGREAKVAALDGYSHTIPLADLERWPVVLATKQNGEPLPLGGFGSLWMVFPRLDVPELRTRNDDGWVWAVIHIAVE